MRPASCRSSLIDRRSRVSRDCPTIHSSQRQNGLFVNLFRGCHTRSQWYNPELCGLQPPAQGPAILPRGRRAQTVNRLADQASDKGRSESCVSRSEVGSSCGYSLSLVPVLPNCLGMRINETLVDGGGAVMYGQEHDMPGSSLNLRSVLAESSRLGLNADPFSESAELSLDPSKVPKRSRWQVPRTSPV